MTLHIEKHSFANGLIAYRLKRNGELIYELSVTGDKPGQDDKIRARLLGGEYKRPGILTPIGQTLEQWLAA